MIKFVSGHNSFVWIQFKLGLAWNQESGVYSIFIFCSILLFERTSCSSMTLQELGNKMQIYLCLNFVHKVVKKNGSEDTLSQGCPNYGPWAKCGPPPNSKTSQSGNHSDLENRSCELLGYDADWLRCIPFKRFLWSRLCLLKFYVHCP